MTDIVSQIKASVDPTAYDLKTAEGRRDFDDALRSELLKISDKNLREHAGQMIKEWRHNIIRPLPQMQWVGDQLQYLDPIRLIWVEVPRK